MPATDPHPAQPPRKLPGLAATFLLATVLLTLVLYITTAFGGAFFMHTRPDDTATYLGAGNGTVILGWTEVIPLNGDSRPNAQLITRQATNDFSWWSVWDRGRAPSWSMSWWFSNLGNATGGRGLSIPLWAILLPLAALAWLTRTHLRSPRPGLCPTCRYDLHALTTNICPECGESLGRLT